MDKYFISNSTKIDNLNALIYSMIVDEKIIASVLPGKPIQTAAHENLWKKNLKEHTDIILGDEKIDVKMASKYITICYDDLEDINIAVIINGTIYIAKLKDIKPFLEPSKYKVFYITKDDFENCCYTKFYFYDDLYEYYCDQQKMFDKIKGKECDMQTIIDLYNIAYKKYFGTTFTIVEKSNF